VTRAEAFAERRYAPRRLEVAERGLRRLDALIRRLPVSAPDHDAMIREVRFFFAFNKLSKFIHDCPHCKGTGRRNP